jgi:hypothetical protein
VDQRQPDDEEDSGTADTEMKAKAVVSGTSGG